MKNVFKATGLYLEKVIVDAGVWIMGGPIDLDEISNPPNTKSDNSRTLASDYSPNNIQYRIDE